MLWNRMTASTAALLACLASAACSNSTQVLVANTPPAAAPRPTAVPNPPITKGAESGKKQILGSASSTLPDCTSDGYPTVTVVKKPQNGQMQIEKSDTYPSFPKDNVRYSCNSQKVPSVTFYYTSTAGFIGTDSVALELLFPDGNIRTYNFNILVR